MRRGNHKDSRGDRKQNSDDEAHQPQRNPPSVGNACVSRKNGFGKIIQESMRRSGPPIPKQGSGRLGGCVSGLGDDGPHRR
jgi:hypothetical protein